MTGVAMRPAERLTMPHAVHPLKRRVGNDHEVILVSVKLPGDGRLPNTPTTVN